MSAWLWSNEIPFGGKSMFNCIPQEMFRVQSKSPFSCYTFLEIVDLSPPRCNMTTFETLLHKLKFLNINLLYYKGACTGCGTNSIVSEIIPQTFFAAIFWSKITEVNFRAIFSCTFYLFIQNRSLENKTPQCQNYQINSGQNLCGNLAVTKLPK